MADTHELLSLFPSHKSTRSRSCLYLPQCCVCVFQRALQQCPINNLAKSSTSSSGVDLTVNLTLWQSELASFSGQLRHWQPCADMTRQHACTHAPTSLTHALNEVLINRVRSHLMHVCHSGLSSQQLCHSWQTTRLGGHECPVHSQHFPIKDLWGINVAWPFARIIRVSGYIKIEISRKSALRAEIEAERWSKSKLRMS